MEQGRKQRGSEREIPGAAFSRELPCGDVPATEGMRTVISMEESGQFRTEATIGIEAHQLL